MEPNVLTSAGVVSLPTEASSKEERTQQNNFHSTNPPVEINNISLDFQDSKVLFHSHNSDDSNICLETGADGQPLTTSSPTNSNFGRNDFQGLCELMGIPMDVKENSPGEFVLEYRKGVPTSEEREGNRQDLIKIVQPPEKKYSIETDNNSHFSFGNLFASVCTIL